MALTPQAPSDSQVTVKVKVVASVHCLGPGQQQQHVRTNKTLACLAKGLCHVFHKCTSTPFLVGYAAVLIEILLMLSGDVERNPGPVGILEPRDLVIVLTELYEVCADWYVIGLALRLSPHALSAMRDTYKEPKSCMREMLTEWLNNSPSANWEGLVAALKSPIVGQESLARRLETNYCTQGSREPPVGDQYEKALTKGKVICNIVVALLMGIAGAGKTSVKELLLGNPPPSAYKSTGMFDAPQIPIVRPISLFKAAKLGSTCSSSWKLLNEKEFRDFIIENYGIKTVDDLSSAGDASFVPQQAFVSSGVQDEAVSEDILELGKEFEDIFKQLQGLRDPIEVTFIYLIDSGGQPQFQELLPAFVKKPTAALCVTKLSEQFKDHPELPYNDRSGKKCGKPSKSPLNNGEILTRYFQVLQSRQSATESPYVFVIGTHKDLEKPGTRPEKNKMLRELLEPKFGEKLVRHSTFEVLFPVNASATEGKDRKEAEVVAQDLRDKIEQTCLGNRVDIPLRDKIEQTCLGNRVDIPLPWFLFEMLLMKLAQKRSKPDRKVNVFKLKECEQVAQTFLMSRTECHSALKFLSEKNVLFYDPDNLPDVVFVSSQVLVSIVTALVYLCYVLRSDEDDSADSAKLKRRCYTDIWRVFCSRGIITSKLLCSQEFKDVLNSQMFGVPYVDGVFTPNDLLRLLKGLHIIAPVKSGSSDHEYIMCCLLPELPLSEGDAHRQSDPRAKVRPLIIEYPKMLLPAGIFTILVGFLLNDTGAQWELAQTETVLKSNCIKFKLPTQPGVSVTLLHFVKYIEVLVRGSLACREVCLKIKGDIHRGLEEAARILGYKKLPSPRECILCPMKGHDGKDPYHVATMHPNNNIWVCDDETCEIEGDLDDGHKMWFHDSELGPQVDSQDPADQEVTQSDLGRLTNLLSEADTKWHELGLQLGISDGQLKAIEADYGKSRRRMSEVLIAWVKGTENPTVGQLEAALRSKKVNEIQLAREVISMYTKL